VKNLPDFTLKAFGRGRFVTSKPPQKEDVDLAQEALHLAERIVHSRNYNIVILDEINVALDLNLISLEDVLELIKSKPPSLELVLTGRNAHEEVIKAADLVTEMKEIKHPFNKGIEARKKCARTKLRVNLANSLTCSKHRG
jgi:cob(I)alamin adenosyltransferase